MSLDSMLRRMEEWDRISHCITELNQSRAVAESDTVAAIEHILSAIDSCKRTVLEQETGTKSAGALEKLVEAAEQVDLISRKRDEAVRSSLSQLKQAVNTALHTEDDEGEWEEEKKHDETQENTIKSEEPEEKSLGIVAASKEESELIDRALTWHFLHEGFLDTAKTFAKEANLNFLPEVDVVRVRSGLDAADAMFRRRDLSPAISWLEEYSSATSSNLLFDMHRLRFLQLATSQTEAIGYAQRNFARFATSRSQEIQTLLGGLLFQQPLSQPSQSLPVPPAIGTGDDRAWEQARQALLNEVRRTYGSMSVLISTGLSALPEIRTYQRLVSGDNRITKKTWKEAQELPVQVEAKTHFHSEFWCPVSQEQTDSLNNPPMLLVCGHVVAKNSIIRIAKGRHRFKCPTCPTDQGVDAPTPIQF